MIKRLWRRRVRRKISSYCANYKTPNIDNLSQEDTIIVCLGGNTNRAILAMELSRVHGYKVLFSGTPKNTKDYISGNSPLFPNYAFEDRSTTTRENAYYSKPLVKNYKNVILVTSLFHMYRARDIFKWQGISVIPYAYVGESWRNKLDSESRSYVDNRLGVLWRGY